MFHPEHLDIFQRAFGRKLRRLINKIMSKHYIRYAMWICINGCCFGESN